MTGRLLCLGGLLENAGFRRGRHSNTERSYAFFRDAQVQSLYEWITCEFSGNKSQGFAAVCWLGVSVTRLVRLKGLADFRILCEVAADQQRGWTVIHSSEQQRDWETSVARQAVVRAAALVAELGNDLLDSTEAARTEARECISDLDHYECLEHAATELRRRASSGQLAASSHLVNRPGVLQVSEATESYEVACLAVVLRMKAEELSDLGNTAATPLGDEQLMWRIQLVADWLLARWSDGVAAT